jgi:hypothetical protein
LDEQSLIRENLGIVYDCWLCLMDEISGLQDSLIKDYLTKELMMGIQIRDMGELYDMQYRVYQMIKMLNSNDLGGGLLKFLRGMGEALGRLIDYLELKNEGVY